jgi:hypothetical protein
MRYLITYILLTGLLAGCTTTKIIDNLSDTVESCSVFRQPDEVHSIEPPELDKETIALIQAALETDHKLFVGFAKIIKWYESNKFLCESQYYMMVKYAKCVENSGLYKEEKGGNNEQKRR